MNKKICNEILTVPNLLTTVRIAMIPFFIWSYVVKSDYSLCLILLLLSGATDVLDGFIARRFHMVSDLGKMLDPIADKLTQAAALLCLMARCPLMLLSFMVLSAKEILSTILTVITIRRSGQVKSALWHGKLCTVFLYAMLALHLFFPSLPGEVSAILIYTSCFLMLTSFILYTHANLTILSQRKKKV